MISQLVNWFLCFKQNKFNVVETVFFLFFIIKMMKKKTLEKEDEKQGFSDQKYIGRVIFVPCFFFHNNDIFHSSTFEVMNQLCQTYQGSKERKRQPKHSGPVCVIFEKF